MHNRAAFLCGFAGVAGALGALFRWMQLGQIVEESGLVQRGSVWSVALTVLLFAAAAILAALTMSLRGYEIGRDYRAALASPSIYFALASYALAVAMAAASAILFFGAPTFGSPVLSRIVALLSFLTAACLPPLANGPKKAGDQGSFGFFAVFPVLFFCFWLIVSYKEHAADPSVWLFAIEILAISSAILSFFFAAGYAFGKPRPMYTLYFSLLCAVLCIVALAENRALAKHLLFLVTAIFSLLRSAVIALNMKAAGRR